MHAIEVNYAKLMLDIKIDEFKSILREKGVEGWNKRLIKYNKKIARLPGVKPISINFVESESSTGNISWPPVGVDLFGEDLSGWVLDGIILTQADCRESNFTNSQLKGAILLNTEFSKSKLVGVDFSNADLSFAIFKNADMRGATFNNTRLLGTWFENTKLDGCDLSKAVDFIPIDKVFKGLGINPDKIEVQETTDDGREITVLKGLKKNSNKSKLG